MESALSATVRIVSKSAESMRIKHGSQRGSIQNAVGPTFELLGCRHLQSLRGFDTDRAKTFVKQAR